MGTTTFQEARALLLARREGYDDAMREFRWPALDRFNWALDWFDAYARDNDRPALRLVRDGAGDAVLSFAQLSVRSSQVANRLRAVGARRGDRVLLMLPNVVPLWETLLGAMKLGLVVVPATTQLGPTDLADRLARGAIRHVVTDAEGAGKLAELAGECTRIVTGAGRSGWHAYDEAYAEPAAFEPDGPTPARPTRCCSTSPRARPRSPSSCCTPTRATRSATSRRCTGSGCARATSTGTSARPAGPSTRGAASSRRGTPGRRCSSYDYARFDAERVLDVLVAAGVTTLCAPPTVWRMLIREDLDALAGARCARWSSAGEPLNPEVIERVRHAWNITIRDGYGQTETTAQIGNSPGPAGQAGLDGEAAARAIASRCSTPTGERGRRRRDRARSRRRAPLGLMAGYLDDEARASEALPRRLLPHRRRRPRDEDGYITYVGRADDVFKSSDYRISPFELESALLEHPTRGRGGGGARARTRCGSRAEGIRRAAARRPRPTARDRAGDLPVRAASGCAPYKRVRRIEFAELPKTISGKIRRVELRKLEEERARTGERGAAEFREEEFPELRGTASARG